MAEGLIAAPKSYLLKSHMSWRLVIEANSFCILVLLCWLYIAKLAELQRQSTSLERRTGETSGSSTGIADGIGVEVSDGVGSVIGQYLRKQDINLDSLETIFENFNLIDVLVSDPLFIALLNQIKNDVRSNLLHMLKTNPELSSQELKEYYGLICWNPRKRLEFLGCLSDRLLWKPEEPNQQDQLKEVLLQELDSKEAPVSDGEWIDKIDPEHRPRRQYDYKSVGGLLRYVRNTWQHRLEDSKQEFVGLGGRKRFHNYIDARFPNLSMKSYRAASRVCMEEKWFEEFR